MHTGGFCLTASILIDSFPSARAVHRENVFSVPYIYICHQIWWDIIRMYVNNTNIIITSRSYKYRNKQIELKCL